MNKLILCEGETDAILLSYYLQRTCGWSYSKRSPAGLDIKADEIHGESANWYRKGDDRLLICAVGSKDRFQRFFQEKIGPPLRSSNTAAFSKIALIIDHDDDTEEEIVRRVREELPLIAGKAEHNAWTVHEYENGYGETQRLDFLLLIIPKDREGALESLLLEAISEDPYDKNIVEKSRVFVNGIAPEASRYIGRHRLVLKAHLGVTWAIQSPQKVFRFIDEQLRGTPWERSEILWDTFEKLREI